MSQKRFIIAGGGTGGHIFPAIAIARALEAKYADVKILFVGAKGKMEMTKVPKEGYDIIGLDIAGFNRSALWKNWNLPLKIFKSAIQAKQIVQQFRPHAVIGVGGYASFPVLNVAQRMDVPTFIQEQNAFAGKSNRILGKKARLIFGAYEELENVFAKEQLLMSGNPVRQEIVQNTITQSDALSAFGLDAQHKTLLVVGGSLGAQSINETIDTHLETLLSLGLNVIWQTGTPYYEKAVERAKAFAGNRVLVKEFIYEMPQAYAAADVVVSRAGALAIAELCIVGKPVIFVPYPFAAEDHQTKNALSLVQKQAAIMLPNDQVQAQLLSVLKPLLEQPQRMLELGQNIKKLEKKYAAAVIVEAIDETLFQEER